MATWADVHPRAKLRPHITVDGVRYDTLEAATRAYRKAEGIRYRRCNYLVNGLPFASAAAVAREIGVSRAAVTNAVNAGRPFVRGYHVERVTE